MEPGFRILTRLPTRTLTRCLVCGSAEVHTDEVIDRGVVFLAECPRCDHRWTRREPLAPIELAPLRKMRREVASAA